MSPTLNPPPKALPLGGGLSQKYLLFLRRISDSIAEEVLTTEAQHPVHFEESEVSVQSDE
jgi:hypothetical protein